MASPSQPTPTPSGLESGPPGPAKAQREKGQRAPYDPPAAAPEPALAQVGSYPAWIHLNNLAADTPTIVEILSSDPAVFTTGLGTSLAGGFVIRPGMGGAAVAVASLRVTSKRVEVIPGAAVPGLALKVFISTPRPFVRGAAVLPAGQELHVETGHERISVIGTTSWYVALGPSA